MKQQIIRHGEVILKPIDKLPEEVKLISEEKKYIVAHSETGHHHVLITDLSKFKVYSWNGETYLEVPEISTLLHEKTGKDVHTPHKVVPGIYKIIIKRSFDYFQKKMTQVRD